MTSSSRSNLQTTARRRHDYTPTPSGGLSGTTGYLYVVLAALLWALSGTASKFLFQVGLSPLHLVQMRATISAFILFLWLFLVKPSLLRVERSDWVALVVLGVALAATQFTYLYAISKIPVAAAILLQYQAPVLIALYTVISRRTGLSYRTAFAIGGAVAGCYLMVGGHRFDFTGMNRAGVISGLVSAASFALYTVRSEGTIRARNPWTVICYALIVTAVVWNCVHQPFGAFLRGYGPTEWSWIFFVGFFGTVLPFGFYAKGVYLIQATKASVTATLEPVIAGFTAYLFLGEVMEPLQIAGGCLVMGAVIYLRSRKNPG